MANTNSLKKGQFLEIEGYVYQVVDFQHTKPGKGHAFVRIVLKNAENGKVVDRKFRSGEDIPDAIVERRDAEYLYCEDSHFHFMDHSNYEQFSLQKEDLGDAVLYLKEQMVVMLLFHNTRCLGIELPTSVDLKVVETEPGIRGNTVSGGGKPATMETGLVVQVPFFINQGDLLRIDTRTGKYIERA